jgi:sugar O-acyltransferase (sialic acid O-acetyltransferase NeuD family)
MSATAPAVGERRHLLLIGAGGFGREAVEVVRSINADGPAWHLLGFLDDAPSIGGGCIAGHPVLGPISDAARHPRASLTICTGSPANYSSRRAIERRLSLPAERYATLVHPTAVIAPSTLVGCGSVLQAFVVTTTDVSIGRHVLVMPHVVLTHDDVVGDFVTIGAGASLAGGVHVGDGAYIGAGALVREGRSVGAGSLVGMGSVVVDDVPPGEVWCGNPARRLRDATVHDAADPARHDHPGRNLT